MYVLQCILCASERKYFRIYGALQINIIIIILKTHANLYTKRLSERRIPTAWKNAMIVIIFKKGNKKEIPKEL